MQQLDFASVSIVIASMSVVLDVVLAIIQLRDQNKSRQAHLFMEIYGQFSRSGFLDFSLRMMEAFRSHKQDSLPEFREKNRDKSLSVLPISIHSPKRPLTRV